MSEISAQVPYRAIQQYLISTSDEYVKHIWAERKKACLLAAGEVLEENGYLPKGTTYEAWGDECWFSIDKGTDRDLAHYFHEGILYGPNFPIFERDKYGNKTGIVSGFRSPKGMPKKPMGVLDQGIKKPAGVWHWTEAVEKGGPLYPELCSRIEEILRR